MGVRSSHAGPNNGDYSVMVNTADCDSVNMGSIPISYPNIPRWRNLEDAPLLKGGC